MKVNAAVVKVLKRELHSSNFSLKHDKPQQFVQCQWQNAENKVPLLYLLYRWCFAIYFITTMVIAIMDVGREDTNAAMRAKWPIYLTNWSYTVCTVQAIIATWLVTEKYILQRKEEGDPCPLEMNYRYKIYWVLNTMGLVTALTLTIYYWVAIYKPGIDDVDAINLQVHAFNSVFMLLDLCILAHPIRLQHFYIPLSFACIFCLFSVVYYFAGGTNRGGFPYLYPVLDWRDPGKAIAASSAGLVAVLILHTLVWLISLWRAAVADKIKCKKIAKNKPTVPV